VGKALAAFAETLVTGRTPFEEFRDALARDDRATMRRYPIAAQRGLKVFVGRGNCSVCHAGPNFSDGEFHDVGVPPAIGTAKVDAGRDEGIRALKSSRFNLLGRFNDDASGRNADATHDVVLEQRFQGTFRTPSLRNVAVTAPYMHNGSLETLRDVVVLHPSERDTGRRPALSRETSREPPLTEEEIGDVVAFLRTLTDGLGERRTLPPLDPAPCQ